MRRRDFLGVLGGATAWPHMVRAQQPGKMQTVGFLVGGTPSSHGRLVAAFAERLRELGWTEGRTVALEVRWAEGRYERFAEIAAELVRLRVDVIVTSPPYGIGVKYSKHKDKMSKQEYLEWMQEIIFHMFYKLSLHLLFQERLQYRIKKKSLSLIVFS